MPEQSRRRMPGGVIPPHGPRQAEPGGRRARRDRGAGARGARRPGDPGPFDVGERPLGMLPETWAPTEEDEGVGEMVAQHRAQERADGCGPSITVWIILVTVIVVIVLAVISYRNAPP